jgi:predicted DNA-binding protein (MmcQ/YjbR family)
MAAAMVTRTKRPAPVSKRFAIVQAVIAARPGAALSPTRPRGGIIYIVGGKMFAILGTGATAFVILKCDPHLAEMLKQQYDGVGHRSHLDRRFWISVDLDADVPLAEIRKLVAHSHAQVCAALSRKQQAALKTASK